MAADEPGAADDDRLHHFDGGMLRLHVEQTIQTSAILNRSQFGQRPESVGP
jgi:hypothetical protein